MARIVALDTATLDLNDDAWSEIAAQGELVRHELTPYDDAVIAERCAGAAIVLTNKVPFSAEVLGRLPELRMIGVLATGYNIIDLQAAKAHGVTVCNVPAYSTTSVVQHALALLLELTNRVALHADGVAGGEWVRSPKFSYWHQAPVELAGATVGVIGWGDIGSRFGAAVHALGARVLAYSPSRRNPPDWQPFAWEGIEPIFERADAVSLHCPQTPENTGFVDAALLRRMKPTALLINTARGGLINEADLAAALREGVLAGAGLDVVSKEPMRADNPLAGAPNCRITPHLAWASLPARLRLMAITADNIRAFLAGTPRNVVG